MGARAAAAAMVAVCGVVMTSVPVGTAAATTDLETEEVIVRLAPDTDASQVVDEVVGQRGEVSAVYDRSVAGFAGELSEAAVADLLEDPRVLAVEPDHPVVAFQTAPPTGIRRIGAHEYAPADIDADGSVADVDVAVLDTGVDGAHPDLRVAGGVDCLAGPCTTVTASDPNGHGTHVAGTAAARDDGVGVVGVAPGARIHSVRVLDAAGQGNLSTLLAGLEWVRANADRIETANLSLGCECTSTTLNDAVAAVVNAGVTLVVSAGNAGTNASSYSPANHPDVIAVAAMSDYDGSFGRRASSGCIPDADDSFASYSNYGAVVDLVAPGSCITSTLPGGGYGRKSGTSMAAPHVAGAVALYLATEPAPPSASRAANVRQVLLNDFSVAATDECGYTDSVSIAPMLHLTCPGIVVNSDPVLEVTSPADGTTVVTGTTVRLRASAHDAEDGTLDAKIIWNSSVDGRLGTGPSLDVTLSTLGDHVISASVTDSSGANTRTSRLVRVTTASGSTGDSSEPAEQPSVPQQPEPEAPPSTDSTPQLAVVAPVSGGRLVADRDVQLVSRATDTEDGDIRAWVHWRSDRDGDLGDGGTVGVQLSAGTHRITASVTDADDNLVERTVGVLVAEPAQLGSRTIDAACPSSGDETRFSDVDADNPHARAIECIAHWQVTTGSGDGTYRPSGTVTRGQMATFLVAMIERSGGSLPQATTDHFDDDDDGRSHEDTINRLAQAGIVQGVGQRRYAPAAGVTREQMATFLVRAYEHRATRQLPGIQQRFPDAATSVHLHNINAVAAAGVAGGVQPERYDTRSAVRRDQMASFIARTLDVLVTSGISSAQR